MVKPLSKNGIAREIKFFPSLARTVASRRLPTYGNKPLALYDTLSGCLVRVGLLFSTLHQECIGQPVLPTGDGEILRWLKSQCSSMCSGEKSAELKSLRAFTAAS